MSQSGARSDVGRVRRTNQDSGYAGTYLFAVADGMGGHAGGDVASHITINHLSELDREFESIDAASSALRERMLEANEMLIKVVDEYPQLAGLGTTLSVVLRVGDQAVLARIGDSRIYRWRDQELEHLTRDHTFVQQLIDTGQVTVDEAANHPRRSVLMRVLGDVDAAPDIDVSVIELTPTDVFLLCSDGLTGVVSDADLATVLAKDAAPQTLANELVTRSLAEGAPDNVTVIVARDLKTTTAKATKLIGSAAGENPLDSLPPTYSTGTDIPRAKAQSLPVHTGGLPITPLRANAVEADFVARRRRRRLRLALVITLVILALVGAIVAFAQWTQSRYFLSAGPSTVLVNQGIPETLIGIPLSHEFVDTKINLSDLAPYVRDQVTHTIAFDSLDEALAATKELIPSVN
jgi:serine/threonine protein phosphatase PrpC